MVTISVSKEEQAKVTIPKEIMVLMGWKDKTEILFVPFLKEPDSEIKHDTPIFIKEIKGNSK